MKTVIWRNLMASNLFFFCNMQVFGIFLIFCLCLYYSKRWHVLQKHCYSLLCLREKYLRKSATFISNMFQTPGEYISLEYINDNRVDLIKIKATLLFRYKAGVGIFIIWPSIKVVYLCYSTVTDAKLIFLCSLVQVKWTVMTMTAVVSWEKSDSHPLFITLLHALERCGFSFFFFKHFWSVLIARKILSQISLNYNEVLLDSGVYNKASSSF